MAHDVPLDDRRRGTDPRDELEDLLFRSARSLREHVIAVFVAQQRIKPHHGVEVERSRPQVIEDPRKPTRRSRGADSKERGRFRIAESFAAILEERLLPSVDDDLPTIRFCQMLDDVGHALSLPLRKGFQAGEKGIIGERLQVHSHTDCVRTQ